MIQKGKYKMAIFKVQEEKPRSSKTPRRRFRWHDEERENDGEVYVDFDWSSPDHINQINDWRSQFSRRQSALTTKPLSIPYHPLEEEFLWYGHAEHVGKEVGNGSIDPTDGGSYPPKSHACQEAAVDRRLQQDIHRPDERWWRAHVG